MPEELFDVCDEQDRVIGQAPRAVVHACGWRHRAAHIWVWNSQGELLLHLRSTTKDEYPSRYTSSASGHLDASEDYATAAHRELWEELQLAGDLQFVMTLPASPATANEHSALYFLESDELPQPDPREIAALRWFDVSELAELMTLQPDLFTPPCRELFQAWRRQASGGERPGS